METLQEAVANAGYETAGYAGYFSSAFGGYGTGDVAGLTLAAPSRLLVGTWAPLLPMASEHEATRRGLLGDQLSCCL